MTTTSNAMPSDFLAAVNPKSATSSAMQVSEDRFLKLLTAQLKNQDPMNPLDNAQMTSQMAQISTVNGIEKLNSTLERLMTNSTDSQVMQASALLGHHVLVAGNGLTLPQDGQAIGGVEFSQSVDSAAITIRDANGLLIRTLDVGVQPAGIQNFIWDGKDNQGVQAAAGQYSFSVSASQGDKAITPAMLQLAQVSGVLRENAGISLELGQLGNFKLTDIRQVF